MFFNFHIPSVNIVWFLYFKIFSAAFSITYLSPRNYNFCQQHVFRHYHRLLCPIIIILIIIISFMQSMYTHIPETNYIPREYAVAAILLFLFVVLISLVSVLNLLYFNISTFLSMCAVPNMAVFCSSWTLLLLLLLLLLSSSSSSS